MPHCFLACRNRLALCAFALFLALIVSSCGSSSATIQAGDVSGAAASATPVRSSQPLATGGQDAENGGDLVADSDLGGEQDGTADDEPSARPSPTRQVVTAVPSASSIPTARSLPTALPQPTATVPPTLTPEPTSTPTPTPLAEIEAVPDATAHASPEPERTPLGAVPTTRPEWSVGNLPPAEAPESGGLLPPSNWTGEVRAVRAESGAVMAVREQRGAGWLVVTPCHQLAEVEALVPITGPIDVLIDPGHGGDETGAVGNNGLREADINLRVSHLLHDELVAMGFRVEMTRWTDIRVAIQSRTELANALEPRIFISVHHNGGFPAPFDRPGTEVFFQKGDAESQRLGGLIFEEIQAAFSDVQIDWVANDTHGVSWRANDRGTDLYGVLRRTPDLVSVLTEAMFISNPPEAQLLAQPGTAEAEARALANAISRFSATTDPGRGYIAGLDFLGELGTGGGSEGCVEPSLR